MENIEDKVPFENLKDSAEFKTDTSISENTPVDKVIDSTGAPSILENKQPTTQHITDISEDNDKTYRQFRIEDVIDLGEISDDTDIIKSKSFDIEEQLQFLPTDELGKTERITNLTKEDSSPIPDDTDIDIRIKNDRETKTDITIHDKPELPKDEFHKQQIIERTISDDNIPIPQDLYEPEPEDKVDVGNIKDYVETSQDTQPSDMTPQPEDYVSVTTIKGCSINIPRIPIEALKTEEDCVKFFIFETARRYRFFQYDNIMEKLNYEEITDAIFDCLEEINETTPQTGYTLCQLVKLGHRYRRLLILGTARNCVLTLISIFTSDGIDIQVEDLSLQNKLGDFQSLFQTLNEQFVEKLKQLKDYDRLTVRHSKFYTGGRIYGGRSSAISRRVSYLSSNGFRIG